MKSRWIAGALLAATLAVPAFGQFSVYIGSAPPPLRYERRPPIPGEGYTWVDGYWGVQGRRYVWVPGRWQQPPFAGAYYSHPHYDHYQKGWQYHEGHWDHEDHGDHHDGDHDRPR
jgi:hypothetical protein